MLRLLTTLWLTVATGFVLNEQVQAFVSSSTTTRFSSSLALSMESEGNVCSRREAMAGVAAAFFLGTTIAPEAASAKYSDYARREKDWEERKTKGEVSYSTARDLRTQLAEIAPMNTASSKIFCPNGPSANVSPLMENKCGDRLAAPSVYGRTNDSMGNSIPGFKEGYNWNVGGSSMSAATGGFPTYKENEWKIRDYGK